MNCEPLSHRLHHLYRRPVHGIKLGLSTIEHLCAQLGNPQDTFLSLHIAGTNGKGSVAAMAERMLRCAGLKTGLYTSPHLLKFNERIRINGLEVTDQELAALMEKVEAADRASVVANDEREASFFEFSTAMAFQHFSENEVQVAVIETGLGGRLDATNILKPAACAITTICQDHTAWLGEDIAAIAGEKAGIIKQGTPAAVGQVPEEALRVIQRTARERGAVLFHNAVNAEPSASGKIRFSSSSRSLPPVRMSLLGKHQVQNACTALALIEAFEQQAGITLPDKALVQGLESVEWAGRFQQVSTHPEIYVDAAHNPQGAAALAELLASTGQGRPVGLLVGFSMEKDAAAVLKILKPKADAMWGVVLDHERGLPASQLEEAFALSDSQAENAGGLSAMLEEARSWASETEGILCIAGSVYLAGEALSLLG